MESGKVTLNRQLGMREGITITTGTVIGVGLFTTGANCVGIMGAGIILLTFIGLLICILPAFMYAEMGAALPYAGGTYNYAKRAISLPVANISAWHYLMALIACCSTESLAFSNYFSWIFKGMGMEVVVDNRIIAAILMFIFVFINYRGVKVSGRWQNAFVFFFWSVSAVWMLTMIHNIDFSNYLPETLTTFPGFKAWVEILTWIWWCYAGFETCVGMGGRDKISSDQYPQSAVSVAIRNIRGKRSVPMVLSRSCSGCFAQCVGRSSSALRGGPANGRIHRLAYRAPVCGRRVRRRLLHHESGNRSAVEIYLSDGAGWMSS